MTGQGGGAKDCPPCSSQDIFAEPPQIQNSLWGCWDSVLLHQSTISPSAQAYFPHPVQQPSPEHSQVTTYMQIFAPEYHSPCPWLLSGQNLDSCYPMDISFSISKRLEVFFDQDRSRIEVFFHHDSWLSFVTAVIGNNKEICISCAAVTNDNKCDGSEAQRPSQWVKVLAGLTPSFGGSRGESSFLHFPAFRAEFFAFVGQRPLLNFKSQQYSLLLQCSQYLLLCPISPCLPT